MAEVNFYCLILVALFCCGCITCNPCTMLESLDITNGVKHQNGSVIHDGVEYKSGTWYKEEVQGSVIIYGCPCIGRTCIWKCCGSQQAFFNRACNETDLSAVNPFSPPVYKGRELQNITAYEHFFYFYGRPCNDSYIVDTAFDGEELFVQAVGGFFCIFITRLGGRNFWGLNNFTCTMVLPTGQQTKS